MNNQLQMPPASVNNKLQLPPASLNNQLHRPPSPDNQRPPSPARQDFARPPPYTDHSNDFARLGAEFGTGTGSDSFPINTPDVPTAPFRSHSPSPIPPGGLFGTPNLFGAVPNIMSGLFGGMPPGIQPAPTAPTAPIVPSMAAMPGRGVSGHGQMSLPYNAPGAGHPGPIMPSAMPSAALGLDLNRNGRADLIVAGPDLNRNGIPDALEPALRDAPYRRPVYGQMPGNPYFPPVSGARPAFPSPYPQGPRHC